jgi:hypothetical protein
MRGIDQYDSQDDGTVFRDVIMLTLLGFVTIVVILLPHLNPPTQAQDIASPGNVFVQISWPANTEDDVDLWVKAPGDHAVGYSSNNGKIFNLLRDDLGKDSDVDNSNFEVAFSRGAPGGEYVINVHLYTHRSGIQPLSVTVEVQLRGSGGRLKRIVHKKIQLTHLGQEITAVRFRLDQSGQLVKNSIHDVPYPLRSGR